MENYTFKLNVDLTTNEHKATVTIENNKTGEMLQSKEFVGTSRDDLMEQAQKIKANFLGVIS